MDLEKLKKNNLDDTLPNLRQYKAKVMKTSLFCNKSRYVDQWNRLENSEMDSHVYVCTCGQIFFFFFSKILRQLSAERII